jgi:hypothetical protein
MLVIRLLVALALLVIPAVASAQINGVGCSNPLISPDAAINVVVLPYSQPASLGPMSPFGEELAEVVKLETMLTIARLRTVAAVHLFHDVRGACAPDAVYARLRTKAAPRPLQPGRALILIWGRIFESGEDLFIQTFIRFERLGNPESVSVRVRDRSLTGRLSTQVFACAPRKISVADFTNVQKQVAEASVLRIAPSSSAPPAREPPTPMRALITEIRNDWIRVDYVPPLGPRQKTPFGGWMQARNSASEWSLRRRMPEIYFVEGVAQYMAARVPRSGLPFDETLANGDAAIARYLDAWGENAVLGSDAAAGGTPLAVAVPRQLRAFISLLRRRGTDAAPLADARQQFERAATLVPDSADARNLVLMARVAESYVKPSADQRPRQFVDDLRGILGGDPGNRTILQNLGAVYALVLTTAPGDPASWELSATDREQLMKQQESVQGLLKPT